MWGRCFAPVSVFGSLVSRVIVVHLPSAFTDHARNLNDSHKSRTSPVTRCYRRFDVGLWIRYPECTDTYSHAVCGAASQIEQTLIAAVDLTGTNTCPIPPFPQSSPCTIPVNADVACNAGGTASYTGSLSGLINFDASGGTTGTLTFAPSSCSIPGSNLLMMGGTTLVFASAVNFAYGQASYVNATETGSIVYGTNPSQVCVTNLTVTASIEGDSEHTLTACLLSGTACGQTISESCIPQ